MRFDKKARSRERQIKSLINQSAISSIQPKKRRKGGHQVQFGVSFHGPPYAKP